MSNDLSFKDLGDRSELSDPFEGLADITQEQLSSLPNAEQSVGLSYERYISLSKYAAMPLVRVLDVMTKVAADDYARNVHISVSASTISFRWNNDNYMLQFRIDNAGGKVVSDFAIPISHLRKLLGSSIAALNLVEKDGKMFALFGSNLVFVETVPFKPEWYGFDLEASDSMEPLDSSYIKTHLRSFTSLLTQTEKASEKILICKGGMSYLMAGAVMGKAKSFFGTSDMVISRPIIESVCILLEGEPGAVRIALCESEETKITTALMDFGGKVQFTFPVQAGKSVDRFISDMFQDAFRYDGSVQIVNASFLQLLNVVNTLDYFTSSVNVEFMEHDFVVTAHKRDETDDRYTFPYTAGSSNSGNINVEISTLLSVLSKADDRTAYAVGRNTLVVDMGSITYCVRSFQMS